MPISDAKRKNDQKWRKKAYDRIPLDIRRDAEINADTIRRYAERKGTSVSVLIKSLIEREIRSDEEFMI